uniref:DUF4005 domain-containing protein n=1 Tax=Davidia involucrata TaxID=16924 RepID=A0A5B7BCR9_DAVIN
MGKKKSWFSFINRLFTSEANSKAEKKSKRWGWVSGRLKFKQYPALPAPQRTLSKAREEQSKRAFAAAVATAAAADAAVAAVHAAAEVVRLSGVPQCYHEYEKTIQNFAAIKIQTAYRAYLARKASRALKGMVRLQAIVRGQLVRRQVITRLKCLSSIIKTESQVHQVTVPIVNGSCKECEKKQFRRPKKQLEDKEAKLERKSQRNWDYGLSRKEEMETIRSRKQEAIIKRERMKKYSFSRQKGNDQTPEESTSSKENRRLSHNFEQLGDAEAYKRRDTEKLKSTVGSNSIASDTYGAQLKIRNVHRHDSGEALKSPLSLPRRSFDHAKQLKLRNMHKRDSGEELNSPFSPPRRSFGHSKQRSIGDNSLPCSPVFRTYMAATESVKAKARSTSAPKQRLGFLDTCSNPSSPYKLRFSPRSSFTGQVTSSGGKSTDTSQQISIRMK